MTQNKTFSRSDPDDKKLIKQSPNTGSPPAAAPSPHFHFQMSYCWSKSRRGNWAWLWSPPPLHKHRNGGAFDWFHLHPTSEDLFLSCLGSSFTVIQYLAKCHLYWWAVHVFDGGGGRGTPTCISQASLKAWCCLSFYLWLTCRKNSLIVYNAVPSEYGVTFRCSFIETLSLGAAETGSLSAPLWWDLSALVHAAALKARQPVRGHVGVHRGAPITLTCLNLSYSTQLLNVSCLDQSGGAGRRVLQNHWEHLGQSTISTHSELPVCADSFKAAVKVKLLQIKAFRWWKNPKCVWFSVSSQQQGPGSSLSHLVFSECGVYPALSPH